MHGTQMPDVTDAGERVRHDFVLTKYAFNSGFTGLRLESDKCGLRLAERCVTVGGDLLG
jgi:hypothetical protein